MTLRTAKRLVDRALETILVGLFATLLFAVVWQVISRYLMGAPSSFTEEIARFSFIALSLLGAAYVAGQNGHLAIDLLPELLGPRGKHRLKWVVLAVSLVFSLALTAGGVSLVRTSFLLGQTSPSLGIPLGWIYATVPLAGLLITFYLVASHACPPHDQAGAAEDSEARGL